MGQRAYVEILSTREVWRAQKRHKSSLRQTQYSSLLSALYLDMSTAEAWTRCSITLSKRSIQPSTRQCLCDYILLPHSCVFILETQRKFTQVS